jgi:hypothetical protein
VRWWRLWSSRIRRRDDFKSDFSRRDSLNFRFAASIAKSGLDPFCRAELHADIVRICMIPLRVVVFFGKLKLPREEGKIVAIVQIRLTHGPRFDH